LVAEENEDVVLLQPGGGSRAVGHDLLDDQSEALSEPGVSAHFFSQRMGEDADERGGLHFGLRAPPFEPATIPAFMLGAITVGAGRAWTLGVFAAGFSGFDGFRSRLGVGILLCLGRALVKRKATDREQGGD
jgi:hypothetical protein